MNSARAMAGVLVILLLISGASGQIAVWHPTSDINVIASAQAKYNATNLTVFTFTVTLS